MAVLPDWVRKYKTKGIEIRVSGENYYAYEMKSRWNREKKRADKITGKYLGVVTRNGIVKPRSIGLVRSDYEYGNISLLYGIAEKTIIPILKEIFSTMWERIISYVILRNIQPLPMKSIRYLYEKTYLYRIMDCKCRSGFVQNRRCKSDPPHITFHSLFSPLLSVCKEFFLLSFSLYDSPFMLMTVQ